MTTSRLGWPTLRQSFLGAVVSLCCLTLAVQQTSGQVSASGTKAAGSKEKVKEILVKKTFNNDPFSVQIRKTATKRGYRIFRLTYPSPVVTAHEPNNTVPADYYLPDGVEPDDPGRPAVICLHILNGNYELVRMLCSSLAQRGVPAIMFKLPYYGERALPGGRGELARNSRLFIESLPQGMLDSQRTFDVLAALPGIDSKRIGISGISLGSFVSAATAGSDDRFYRTGLLLSGGDLLSIIQESDETSSLNEHLMSLPAAEQEEIKQAIASVDPLTYAAGLRERALDGRVLMINGDQDKVVPPAATKKLAEALGISDQVFWLEGLGHYTAVARLPEIMRRTVDFFAQDLPPGIQVPTIDATAPKDPVEQIANLISQAAGLFTVTPAEGRCHLADIDVSVAEKGGKTYEGKLQFARGTDHRFRIQLDVPMLGKAYFGQDTYPWMATDKAVFLGSTAGSVESRDPLTFADAGYLGKVKMVTGMMATLPLAPALLEQLVQVESETLDDGTLVLHVSPRKKSDGVSIQITFQQDQKTPKSISFDIEGMQGTLTFRSWQSNSVAFPSLFQPPPDIPVEDVDKADLLRIYASLFNFAMEFTE
ncbi:MAG: prolyl oligopeptidase family serine peptidase [Planctomycetes bacterium]|nr:prolyl oligopeptidase family serine peptidase [Planctomycetota bacterium]